MPKAIGILTMRYARNYGGILQCVALSKVLESRGFLVEVIDYAPTNRRTLRGTIRRGFNLLFSVKSIYRQVMHRLLLRTKPTTALSQSFLDTFQQFKANNLRFTQHVDETTIGQVAAEFDAIIVGSDQIWNCLTHRPIVHLCDWIPEYTGTRISYAACSIYESVDLFHRRHISSLLHKFHGISVRDVRTQQLVKNCSKIIPEIVADPTCLYDFEGFISDPGIKEPYIFVYLLGSEIEGGHKRIIDSIKDKYGELAVYAVVIANVSLEAERFADKVLYSASPNEWLSLLAYSTFVYTDSFHGCMFSMKYEKPFLAYYKEKSRASRLLDLADRFEVGDVVVDSVDAALRKRSIEKGIDYGLVNRRMRDFQETSLAFLDRNLRLIEKD